MNATALYGGSSGGHAFRREMLSLAWRVGKWLLSACLTACIHLLVAVIHPQSAVFTCAAAPFCRVTNPHEFEVDGISFLGTSGQNIDDIYKYSVEENRLMLLQRVLEWGHLVPTAPDTLTCYPLSESDPFILESAPHVFFVGNQPTYSSQMITGVLATCAKGRAMATICFHSLLRTPSMYSADMGHAYRIYNFFLIKN